MGDHARSRESHGRTPKELICNHAAFIWSVADLLRGDFRRSEYGRVILPLVVLRRLDCVLEPTGAGRGRAVRLPRRHPGRGLARAGEALRR